MFILEHCSVVHFCAATAVAAAAWGQLSGRARGAGGRGTSKTAVFVFLSTLGVLRASNVYFRCREEQSDGGGGDRCAPPSLFHLPIGNLPNSADYAAYKNRRFGATIASTLAVVAAPILWLR